MAIRGLDRISIYKCVRSTLGHNSQSGHMSEKKLPEAGPGLEQQWALWWGVQQMIRLASPTWVSIEVICSILVLTLLCDVILLFAPIGYNKQNSFKKLLLYISNTKVGILIF